MKKRIDIKWSREEVDIFLKKQYGSGIWEFEMIIAIIYGLYDEKVDQKLQALVKKRIAQLENLKTNTLKMLDDFLTNIGFYKLDEKLHFAKIEKWTTKNRIDFIVEHYKLSEFFSIIDGQNSYLKRHSDELDPVRPRLVQFPVYIKPINFLILIFNHALKRGKKRDWINLEILFNWFSPILKEMDFLELFGYEEESSPPPETLRLIWNKYRKTKYGKMGNNYYNLFFKVRKEEGEEKFPKPLEELKEFLEQHDVGVENRMRLYDFFIIMMVVYDFEKAGLS